jgi:hypothetical protein
MNSFSQLVNLLKQPIAPSLSAVPLEICDRTELLSSQHLLDAFFSISRWIFLHDVRSLDVIGRYCQ